ncbi:MAG TPA: hypothetical protein VE135_12985 [Pyrinomonadaceae bacterium]|nr:hypothetical protein [Pyrinomonadaceae bacterium]
MDQDPNAPSAENRDELRTKLELMLEALEKPILDYEEVGTKEPINQNSALTSAWNRLAGMGLSLVSCVGSPLKRGGIRLRSEDAYENRN